MDNAFIQALCEIHQGLTRKAPGSDRITHSLIERVRPLLPERPRAADMGCGGGHAALLLAEELAAEVVAVDFYQGFLDELAESLKTRPSRGIVTPRCADMATPGVEAESLDLIWSEGASFTIGTPNALKVWYGLLKPGGVLVLSECSWFDTHPPAEAKAFWDENYAEMMTVGDLVKCAEGLDYAFLHAEALPSEDWWTSYYDPMAARLRETEPNVEPGSAMAEVIRMAWLEQENFRRCSDHFGYTFLALRK